MYSYQGQPSSPSTPTTDWANEIDDYRMDSNFVVNTPHGVIHGFSSGNTGEFGNPCWKIKFQRKNGDPLGDVVCFGSNPQRDRAAGLRRAASKLQKLREIEGI